ncbi:hypothetical protein [Desulfosporosinus youngiae]|uniref:Uncharacterized protein n=1 Tax=Desulfosporosinus youngiae DSM 17734 TaxID=768710 RepID=H5XZQ2_9FIRM|nr:hypothetical protein [Desulfosporosinus youngiae]EHQ92026.1 hypothetical protein DesyoDRAFT_5092 [Desulfosporosinus youngiae DSM 17734]
MSRGLKLFNNPNTLNLMQSLGQNPFPLRGVERFMQKRGMDSGFFDTLKVQVPPGGSGGIKAFLNSFTGKFGRR